MQRPQWMVWVTPWLPVVVIVAVGYLLLGLTTPPLTAQNVAGPGTIIGPARVVDGDTLEIVSVRIRIHGIDAPEMDQTCKWPNQTIRCGDIARTAMLDLIAGVGSVRCDPIEKDRYGRTIATCFAPDGFDIGRNMVHTGWALAYRKYSGKYVSTEKAARKAKRGMWRGEFVKPWEWRRGSR